jgi:hypothetical protein
MANAYKLNKHASPATNEQLVTPLSSSRSRATFNLIRIYINRRNMTCDLCNLQREPTIARAKINLVRVRLDANGAQHATRVRP